jgi:hypothetical protein
VVTDQSAGSGVTRDTENGLPDDRGPGKG